MTVTADYFNNSGSNDEIEFQEGRYDVQIQGAKEIMIGNSKVENLHVYLRDKANNRCHKWVNIFWEQNLNSEFSNLFNEYCSKTKRNFMDAEDLIGLIGEVDLRYKANASGEYFPRLDNWNFSGYAKGVY